MKEFYIDIITGAKASLHMTAATLPKNWTTTYISKGRFIIKHNLKNSQPGLAVSAMYNGAARIVNLINITPDTITFQITDVYNMPVEGNVIGKIIF